MLVLGVNPDAKLRTAQYSLTALLSEVNTVLPKRNKFLDSERDDDDSDDSDHDIPGGVIVGVISDLSRYVECLAESSSSLNHISKDCGESQDNVCTTINEAALVLEVAEMARPYC